MQNEAAEALLLSGDASLRYKEKIIGWGYVWASCHTYRHLAYQQLVELNAGAETLAFGDVSLHSETSSDLDFKCLGYFCLPIARHPSYTNRENKIL